MTSAGQSDDRGKPGRPAPRGLMAAVRAHLPVFVLLAAVARPALARPDAPLWAYFGGLILLVLAGRAALDEDGPVGSEDRDPRGREIIGISLLASPLAGAFEFARIGPWWELPLFARWAGVGLVVAGYLLRWWAIRTNRFFSGAVTIQRNRGHTVVDAGPYRVVRHPAYTGLLLVLLGTPLVFSAALGFATTLPGLVGLFRRTAREDRFLAEELDGYRAYQARVRARLVPGLY